VTLDGRSAQLATVGGSDGPRVRRHTVRVPALEAMCETFTMADLGVPERRSGRSRSSDPPVHDAPICAFHAGRQVRARS
jgi:hypothetical protein